MVGLGLDSFGCSGKFNPCLHSRRLRQACSHIAGSSCKATIEQDVLHLKDAGMTAGYAHVTSIYQGSVSQTHVIDAFANATGPPSWYAGGAM